MLVQLVQSPFVTKINMLGASTAVIVKHLKYVTALLLQDGMDLNANTQFAETYVNTMEYALVQMFAIVLELDMLDQFVKSTSMSAKAILLLVIPELVA